MPSSFSDLGLPADAIDALSRRGITEAFPIQALAIPPALDGRDVCGRAPTGAGKTLAFGLPLAQRVAKAQPRRPRALVLAPTRELAAQIHDELRWLLAPRGRTVHAFYGGVGFGPQVAALRKGVDVVVACPGRLADLIGSGEVRLDDVEIAVIDEADRMADMGFLPEVKRLLDQVRSDRQTLLFSATLDGDVDVLVRRYQHDPVRCELVPDDDEPDRTTHHLVRLRREDRIHTTASLVARHGSAVVFCRTKHGTDRVARQLGKAGVDAVPIHGGRSQAQRTRALAAFADGKAQALVATDVAARGIHVDDVALVVHFDVAGDAKDYVHRSGRTGRAGAEGRVFTLVTEADGAKLKDLRKGLEIELLEGDHADVAVVAPREPGSSPSPARTGGSTPRSSEGRSSEGRAGSGGRSGGGHGGGRSRRDDDRRGGGRGKRRRSGGQRTSSSRGDGSDHRSDGPSGRSDRRSEGSSERGGSRSSNRSTSSRRKGKGGSSGADAPSGGGRTRDGSSSRRSQGQPGAKRRGHSQRPTSGRNGSSSRRRASR